MEQSGQAHINSLIHSIIRGLNTFRAEHGCNATITIRASALPCGAFLSYRRRSFLYDKKGRYFRIGNICHQSRNLLDTDKLYSPYPNPCNVGIRLSYLGFPLFTSHLTNPFRSNYPISFHQPLTLCAESPAVLTFAQ